MTAPIADLDSGFPIRSTIPNSVDYRVTIPIGVAGATGTLADAPNGLAVTVGSAGVYAVTGLPPCPAATSTASKSAFSFQVQSPALTVVGATITVAHDHTNGTLTFTTTNGSGAATNPANGDVVVMFITMERE